MANILFTWEIGEGSGHIAHHIGLIKQLEKENHHIFFAARQLNRAYRLFQDTQVICLQAPSLSAPPAFIINPVDSYVKILNNSGYCNADNITGMIIAWKNLFDLVRPDLIIFDYSPTAMLAARQYPAKTIHIGTGFYCPPNTKPVIGLNSLQGDPQDQQELIHFEELILSNINQALANLKMKALGQFGDLHQADVRLLLGFRELEHYPNRTDGNYIGILTAPPGAVPEWPEGKGPRIFMYTKPFSTLPKLLGILRQKQWPTLIYPDGLGRRLMQHFASPSLKFVEQRLDMDNLGKTADITICNGNFNTTCEFLLAGVPMLLLPLHAEQHIVSRNIVRQGAGLCSAEKTPEDMASKAGGHDQESAFSDFSPRLWRATSRPGSPPCV